MSDTNNDSLRKLAEASLQDAGEWKWDGRTVDEDGYVYIPECSNLVGGICLADQHEGYQAHCDFIAAASPPKVIELLDTIQSLEEKLEVRSKLSTLVDNVLQLLVMLTAQNEAQAKQIAVLQADVDCFKGGL